MAKRISILAVILIVTVASAFAIPAVIVGANQAAAARTLARVPGTRVESTSRGWIIVMGPLTGDRDLEAIVHIGDIDQLVLRGPITDDGIALVGKNSHIRTLSLQGLRNPLVTDGAGALVARITHLEEINFRDTLLGDQFLSHLVSMPHLRVVDASGSLVTDGGAKLLSKARGLETVRLPAATVSEEAMRDLQTALRCEVTLTH